MARVNYSFEKRKRELDRKSKKAAKAEKRAQEGGGSARTTAFPSSRLPAR